MSDPARAATERPVSERAVASERAASAGVVTSPPEDERGVDVAQLRRNLALTPAERIAAVVEAARAIQPLRAAGSAHRAGGSAEGTDAAG
jgi:hypothetical protein